MIDIKTLMFDKSLSQRKMADIMNTTQSEVSQIANGNRRMLRKHIDGLIEFFGEEVINQYSIPDEPIKPASQDATITIYDKETVEELEEEIIEKVRAEEIKTTFVLPPDVVRNPEVNIKRDIEKGELDDYTKPIQDCLPMHDCIVQTYCDDMEPEIRCGERVLAQMLPKGLAVTPGQIYFIDLPSGGVIRYIDRKSVV